jgi:sarcosine oxidase subunit delta
MMLIECPWCGHRPESEFHCGGTSHIQRPALDCSDAEWGDYLFGRANPCGVHAERWRHTYGCSQWFNLARDTRTHTILAVYGICDPMPALAAVAGDGA